MFMSVTHAYTVSQLKVGKQVKHGALRDQSAFQEIYQFIAMKPLKQQKERWIIKLR